MLNKVLSLVIITSALLGCSKDYQKESTIELIPFSSTKNGKWGYINCNGDIVIDTLFINQPGYFREGYAIIKNTDGTFDYINRKGSVTKENFKEATLFSEGLACVARVNQYPTYVNENFETVIRLDFASEAGVFSEGMAKFQDKNGKWGFINKSGRIVVKPVYHYAMSFCQGLALVAINTKNSIQAGFINKFGGIVIPLSSKFINLRQFSEGMAAFKTAEGWGFMNKHGATVIKPNPEWVEVTDFHEGYSSVRIGDNWGIIDSQGYIVIEPQYETPLVFFNGLAAASIAGVAGFIDINNKFVFEPQYEAVPVPFLCKNALVISENQYLLIDRKGKISDDNNIFRINEAYSEVFDYEKTVRSDYFDILKISGMIIMDIDTNSVNGISKRVPADSLAAQLDSLGFEFEGNKNQLTAEKYRNYNYELLSRNIVTLKDLSTDSSGIKNFKTINTLSGNGKGKQNYVKGALLMKLFGSGFRFRSDSVRYIFYSDSAAVFLYTNFNDIIVDYWFYRKHDLDSNFNEIK